jgi:hypothetical protein
MEWWTLLTQTVLTVATHAVLAKPISTTVRRRFFLVIVGYFWLLFVAIIGAKMCCGDPVVERIFLVWPIVTMLLVEGFRDFRQRWILRSKRMSHTDV